MNWDGTLILLRTLKLGTLILLEIQPRNKLDRNLLLVYNCKELRKTWIRAGKK